VTPTTTFKDNPMADKAKPEDFMGRFREIISDPLNLLIRRVPDAGLVSADLVTLHNGLRVPFSGPHAYYDGFSDILALNRGVHEPLEEYAFQQLLTVLPAAPTMLELGAYWGHYSMWLKHSRAQAQVHLVEPVLNNLQAGMANFQRHGFEGEFIHAFVGAQQFRVDQFVAQRGIQQLDVLHADIQGHEVEMLLGCEALLAAGRITYAFVSTHSQDLHRQTVALLQKHAYRIEAQADFDVGTTSYDGFVFASCQPVRPVFLDFAPLARVDINRSSPQALASYVARLATAA